MKPADIYDDCDREREATIAKLQHEQTKPNRKERRRQAAKERKEG